MNPLNILSTLAMTYVLPFPFRSAGTFFEGKGYCHVMPFYDFLYCRSLSVIFAFPSFESLGAVHSGGVHMGNSNFGDIRLKCSGETCIVPYLVSCISNAFSKWTSHEFLSTCFPINSAIGKIQNVFFFAPLSGSVHKRVDLVNFSKV